MLKHWNSWDYHQNFSVLPEARILAKTICKASPCQGPLFHDRAGCGNRLAHYEKAGPGPADGTNHIEAVVLEIRHGKNQCTI